MLSPAEQIFIEAQQLAPQARSAHLAEACGDDALLRGEVEGLLDAANRSDDYFCDVMARVLSAPAALAVPARIDRYRVLRLLGRGGMGAVYLAERTDGQFEKQVALKVLPEAIADPAAVQRFLTERQILAGLVHPHICRLLDGGVSEDGMPFFVMDFVDGQRIDAYCDHRRMGMRERLQLFVQVCDAVQFAHRSLILHRDLKPSNIFVAADGGVQLLDFGVGKILQPDQPGGQTEVTQLPLTPAYASPEIIKGEPATTASDVYSLGVVLYQLLCGKHPHELENLPLAQALASVCQQAPLLASRRLEALGRAGEAACLAEIGATRAVSPAQLTAELRGDLDNILARCLSIDTDRRYTSAEALATDIVRYLEHRPVSARPPTRRYLVEKFIQRHRVPFALAVLAGLALLALGAVTVQYALDTAAKSRDIARQRDRAQAISDFFIGVFEQANPSRQGDGGELTVRELVDQAVTRLDQSEQLHADTESELLRAAANMYVQLGAIEQAVALLEREVRLQQQAVGTNSDAVANALERLSEVQDAGGNWGAAEAHAQQALRIREAIDDPLGLAASYNRVGRMHHLKGDYVTAEEHYRRALAIQRTYLGERDIETAQTRSHLASVALHQGRLAEAERLHREVLEIRRERYGDNHLQLMENRLGLGQALLRQQRFEESREYLLRAVATNDEFLGEGSRYNAFLFGTLGEVEQGMGNFAAARGYFESSMAIWRGVAQDHPNLGIVAGYLGKLLLDTGRFDEAVSRLEQSLAILRNATPDHWRVHQVEAHLAAALTALGDYDRAEALLMQAYPALKGQFGFDDARSRAAAAALVSLYEVTQRSELAEPYRSRR